MARVHAVNKARKAYPKADIEIGDSYYWWKFRYGARRMSKTYPKPSQTTNSAFLSGLYFIQESIDVMDDPELLEGFISEIEELRDECEYSLGNMPEQLQESSDSGVMLQDRIDGLDSWLNELEGIDADIEDGLDVAEYGKRKEEILDAIKNCECGV